MYLNLVWYCESVVILLMTQCHGSGTASPFMRCFFVVFDMYGTLVSEWQDRSCVRSCCLVLLLCHVLGTWITNHAQSGLLNSKGLDYVISLLIAKPDLPGTWFWFFMCKNNNPVKRDPLSKRIWGSRQCT